MFLERAVISFSRHLYSWLTSIVRKFSRVFICRNVEFYHERNKIELIFSRLVKIVIYIQVLECTAKEIRQTRITRIFLVFYLIYNIFFPFFEAFDRFQKFSRVFSRERNRILLIFSRYENVIRLVKIVIYI